MGSLFRKSEEHYCEVGMQQLTRGDANGAARSFEKGLSSYPKSWALRSNRANLFIVLQRFDLAAEDLDRALELMPKGNPARPAVRLMRGTCYVHLQQDGKALADLDAALNEGSVPQAVLAKGFFYRALLRLESPEVDLALADAEQAVKLDPSSPRYSSLLADLRQRKASPSSPEIERLGQEGVSHLQAGRSEQALALFEKILEIEPKHAKAFQLKGAALHKLERFEEELEALNQSYALDGNEVALFNRAACHLAMGNITQAVYDLKAFVRVGRDQATVLKAQSLLATIQGG